MEQAADEEGRILGSDVIGECLGQCSLQQSGLSKCREREQIAAFLLRVVAARTRPAKSS